MVLLQSLFLLGLRKERDDSIILARLLSYL